jgi:DNA-packaging protein gp3
MSDRDESGRFLPGNRFWEARSSAGPNPKFDGPEPLWAACLEYFAWVQDNPLYADQLVTFQGSATHEPVAKMRAMTLGGLCLFLDITDQTWRDWRADRPDLIGVITRAESVIYQQKFTGAAADLLNPNIIARDLGLADKKELSGGVAITVSPEDANL